MASSAPSGIPEFAAIGIGAGVGGLVLLMLCGLVFYTYTRQKNAIREIEGGLDSLRSLAVQERKKVRTASRSTSKTDLLKKKLGPPVPYGSARWSSLSSKESINHVSITSPTEKNAVSAYAFPANNHPANNVSPRSKRVRLGRALTVKGSRVKALSAIIESPRSARSALDPTAVRIHDSASTTDLTDLRGLNEKSGGSSLRLVQNASDDDSISSPPPLQSCPTFKKPRLMLTEPAKIHRPMPMRSKSVGVLPDQLPPLLSDLESMPKRPVGMHMRSISSGATTAGPAPTCPLPPLPRFASQTRVSREGTPEITDVILPQSERDRAYSDLIGNGTAPELNWQSATSGFADRQNTLSLESRSENGKRDSVSSLTPSLDEAGNRLSLPRIATADRVSISRVSSVGSFASDASLRITSTPKLTNTSRPKSGTRVSITGSPDQRRKSSNLLSISGNASLLTPARKDSTVRHSNGSIKSNTSTPKSIIPSAMKGSPTARKKGHKRQNCVRISKTVVEFFPPPSRSVSPSLEGIAEESPEGGERRAAFGLAAPDLKPPTAAKAGFPAKYDPVKTIKLRASLTPSSPTLSMSRFQTEFSFPSKVVLPQPEDREMSRESSMFSIPTMASFTDLSFDQDTTTFDQDTTTPAIEVTRPSCDLDAPDDDDQDVDDSLELPQHNAIASANNQSTDLEYDPVWGPLIEEVAKGYDPLSPTQCYPSPASSLKSLPRAAKEFVFNCSDPMTMACLPMYFDDMSDYPSSPPLLSPVRAEDIPLPESTMSEPVFMHESAHQSPLGSNPPTRATPQLGSDNFMDVPLYSTKTATPPITITPHSRAHSRQASLLGPRTQPALRMRDQIEKLRRMNSEIFIPEEDKAGGRRYLRLGREASPSLPFTGFGDDDLDEALLYEQTSDDESNYLRRDEQTKEDPGFDFGFIDSENQDPSTTYTSREPAHMQYSTISLNSPSNYSPLSNTHSIHTSPMPARKPATTTATSITLARRPSTVWDDGENYWNDLPSSTAVPGTFTPQQTQPHSSAQKDTRTVSGGSERKRFRDITFSPLPAVPAVSITHELAVATTGGIGSEKSSRTAKGRVAALKSQAPSTPKRDGGVGRESLVAAGTPRSLYDADGFLRG
ncbi:hypothetical protein MBLNU457_g1088t1 [Dothideomycetes sp. NU457]